jgi:hypothetical protein
VSKETRTNLDSKGVKCIFILYYEEIKGYSTTLYANMLSSIMMFFDESRNFNKEIMASKGYGPSK